MPCLTRVPAFRTFQTFSRKGAIKHTKNCANADIRSAIIVGAAVATVNGTVGIALNSAVPGNAFTEELTVGVHGRLPGGARVSTTGTITGTPVAGSAGTYPLVANAIGVNGRISSVPFNLVIV